MTKLIAFDQSTTCTGWCVMEQETGKLVSHGFIKPFGTTDERSIEMIKKIIKLCSVHDVTFVFIEGVQFQKNPVVFEVLAALHGVLRLCLTEKGYFVNSVKAPEWRKRVGIKNKKRADVKEEAIKKVKELYDLDVGEDECEAILFARAFCA
ncbi:Holliday junction resolvasome RuvABC endonuclease subunit [Pilibacter termitis]|uniref:Holliday junction resolvasome RuvABC endonuclease subunit n=1 Tax=Pilibacter termitis TaxID=263852 RepID=A0A1T4RCJ3_9ENTE|nr:crossover junction endodeoxyribonuclease RuvC [Pilibacter termitis]SKA13695.1 Holliday junction resolvasome RuvABC endonuclease subunit [Pilibacter termitis]